MNDLEFKILERIDQTIRRESEHTEIYKLNLAPAIDVKKAIGDLINDGLIKYISGSTILRLTKAGIDAYKREVQRREEKKQQAEQERFKIEQAEKHHREIMNQNRRIAIFGSISGGIMGIISSLLVQLLTN